MTTPPLPPGFELEQPQASAMPPLPPGFEMMPDGAGFDDGPGLEIDIVGGIPESAVAADDPRVTDGMSGFEKFSAGVGKSVVDTGYGLAQMAVDQFSRPANIAQAAVDQFAPGGILSKGVERTNALWLQPQKYMRAQAAERRALDSDLMDTGAGLSGNLIGTVAQILGPGAYARGTSLAPAILPTTIRGNALQGALIGAVQPNTSEQERGLNTLIGGVGGAAGAGLVKLVGAGASGVRNLLSRTGLSSADKRAAGVLAREATHPNALAYQQSAVPGVRLTLGESTQDSGLMALENAMRARNRGAFEAIDLTNNAARASQLERIAGSNADMAAAKAERSSVAKTMRDKFLAEADEADRLAAFDEDGPEGMMRLFHGSKSAVPEILGGNGPGNIFGGVFAGSKGTALSHGPNVHVIDVPEEAILRQRALDYDIPYEDQIAALRKAMPRLADEDLEIAYKATAEDASQSIDPDDLIRVFNADDVGEASWEAQRIRGEIARRLGYRAAEMSDEHGTSFLVLPGNKIVPEGTVVPGSATAQLVELAEGLAAKNAPRPSVSSAIGDALKSIKAAGDSAAGLYRSRQYIGDLLEGKAGPDKGYARAATRELMEIRDALDHNLAARAPSFPEYLKAYQQASKPINRMQVGRKVIQRSSGAVPDQLGNPSLTPAGVMRATGDLDAIAAKATGFKKAVATDILSADDIAAIKAIQDDMMRQAARQKSAVAGSQTAERLEIGGRIAKQSLATRIPWAGQFFEHFEARANERLQERLVFMLANPDEAKRVLAALPANDRAAVRSMLGNLALASGRSSSTRRN